tara:strand:- start:336 stop:512 length:177 start_codon:yes stop_codon:yes gene_type:complete
MGREERRRPEADGQLIARAWVGAARERRVRMRRPRPGERGRSGIGARERADRRRAAER